jgi:hypothetical protein
MKSELKNLLKRILPDRALASISSRRWWNHLQAANRRAGRVEICRRLIDRCGTRVIDGPFKGLDYPYDVLLSHCSTPHLLGTYEVELHQWIEVLLRNSYEKVVDIGAGEGYYAVGFAMRMRTTVDAYETGAPVRRSCRRIVALNGVSTFVRLYSWCSAERLSALREQRCLVLSDCEGWERKLFTPEVAKALARSDLIIELHDNSLPKGTTRSLLEDRLQATHTLTFVKSVQRELSDFPQLAFLRFLGEHDAREAISEGRPLDQEWMIAIAKT